MKVGMCILWGIPFTSLALAAMVTVVGIPIGLILLSVAAWPWHRVNKKRAERIAAWEYRDHSLNEDEEVPWET